MPTIRDNAVCIRRWDYSETSQTASLFTREHGIIRGLAKGAKRGRGKFSGGLDPLTRGQVVAVIKPNRDLATLTEWHLEEVFWAVRRSLAANRAGLFMADLIHHMLTGHDPHPGLFDQFTASLAGLNEVGGIEPAVLRFQWALLRETGYQPQLERDSETGEALPPEATTLAFSARAGGLAADTGAADRWRVRAETVGVLRSLAAGDTDWRATPVVVGRANRLLAAYCRELIGTEPAAMRWAFPDPVRPAERTNGIDSAGAESAQRGPVEQGR
ncbi:MAG: DNA repair protein RecO [Phycisphaerales bacterium]|nr:MAG: DNA repair protein RecO [Phycisphaerales bacterium]